MSILRLHNLTLLVALIVLIPAACWAQKATADAKAPAVQSAGDADMASEQDLFAQLIAPEKTAAVSKEPSTALVVASFVGKLVLVLVIAYVCIFVLKKINNFKAQVVDGKKHVVVVEQTSLAPGRHLVMVNVAGRSLLLGSTPQGVNLLAELDPEQIPELQSAEPLGFKEQLTQFLGQNPKKAEAARSVAEMLRESSDGMRASVSAVNAIRGNIRGMVDE